MNNRDWRKLIHVSFLSLGIFILGVTLTYSGVLRPLERFFLDFKFRYLQQEDPNNKIVLISIDEKSLSYFSRNNVHWPWPREFYYVVNDYLNKAGANLVVYDILFDTPGFDRSNLDGSLSDRRFARSMRRSDNSIIAFKSTPVTKTGELKPMDFPEKSIYPVAGSVPEESPHILTSVPIPMFQKAALGLGNTILRPDPDGIIRTVHLFDSLAHSGFVPTLAMSAYLNYKADSAKVRRTDDHLKVGDMKIPLIRGNQYLINWYEKGGVRNGTFPYYSFHEVVNSATSRQLDNTADVSVPPSVFEDKIVVIGATAAGLGDIKSTPMSSLEPFAGMEIQATVLNNLIGRDFIRQFSDLTIWILLLLITFGIIFLVAYSRPLVGAVGISAISMLIVTAGCLLFYIERFWFPTGSMFLMAMISYIGSSMYKYFAEERQKQQIKSAFDQYVQPELVDRLIKNPEMLKLGGEKKHMTVLFSDLAGFTAISEETPPDELITFLNHYLGIMTDLILEHKGTLDKFIGDAVMAFWGAPVEQEDHAVKACRSTLRMIEKLDHLEDLPERYQDIHTHARFGINTGEMIVGNIGSTSRFNYTVLGDAVNLAARLESANKSFGSQVMISETTYRQLPDDFYCRQLDLLVVKGKSKPVRVFELMADRDSPVDFDRLERGINSYREGLDLYYNRNWDEAIQKFEQVLHYFEDDGPSLTYIERCRKFKENPPEEDWDGVFHLETK